MNVLDRPLFRQAGGPAQPMPQDMMPPQGMPQDPGMAQDPMAAIQGLEQQAAGQMKQVGQQYAMETMAKLDAASDPKQVIDALRGNERPLEERYAELAQYVGQEDAAATPESVLAFVQPTIMMTEEGAMDTGIGQLIQSMTGDTAMSGDMGQGVGSLMMAGAQEAPAPANFRQGGPVQKFEDGGGVNRAGNIRTAYEQLLPLYQDILGQREEDRNMSKAQSYFDLAGAGLALAGGVDPRTGQSMAGAPLASQIARAAAPLPQQFAARAAAQRDAERQIQAGALQGAIGQQQREEDFQQRLGIAMAGKSPKTPDLYTIDGETYNANDPTQLSTMLKIANETGVSPRKVGTGADSSTTVKPVMLVDEKGNRIGRLFNYNNPTDFDEINKMLGENAGLQPRFIGTEATKAGGEDKPSLSTNEIRGLFGDAERITAFASGADDFEMLTAIQDYTQPKMDPITGSVSQNKLPKQVVDALQKRGDIEEITAVTGTTPINEVDAEMAKEGLSIIDPNVDITEATGPLSGLKTWGNKLAGLAQEFGVGEGVMFKDTASGRAQLETLNTEFMRYLTEGRTLASELQRYENNLPDYRTVGSDFEALERIDSLRDGLSLAIDRSQTILDNPNVYQPATVSKAREDIAFLKQLSQNYDIASDIYQKVLNISGQEGERPPLESFYRQ